MIHFSDIKAQLEKADKSGNPMSFSIEWVKADRNRKTGGQAEKAVSAVKCSAYYKGTVKIKQLPSEKIVPVHLRLITAINGEEVAW